MSEQAPLFLTKEQVLAFHSQQLDLFGGQAGIGDPNLLDSALSQPQNTWSYQPGADVFDLGAAYAFHLAKNHPFCDGNKRTALQSCLGFLAGNGIRLTMGSAELYAAMIKLTTSELSKQEFAAFLRRNAEIPDE